MFAIFLILSAMIGIYFCLCVQESQFTILGRIKSILKNIFQIMIMIIPERHRSVIREITNYCFYKRNPIIQILYLVLVFGLLVVFIMFGVDEFLPNDYFNINYIYIGYFLCFICLLLFYYACIFEPGIVSKRNINNYRNKYEYDNILYEIKDCQTCKIPKIPRSKHCNVCNVCVDKFDHHCIWINQCVGAKNYRFFLYFIITHFILCFYGFSIGVMLFYSHVMDKKLNEVKFYNKDTSQVIENTPMTVIKYLISKYYAFFSANVMLLTISIILFVFIIYHLSLIRKGNTTNEQLKRAKYIQYMKIIKVTLNNMIKQKNLDIKNCEKLTTDDIKKFKKIVFENPEFDLSTLSCEEIAQFMKFADNYEKLYQNNIYNKGFINNLKDIVNGI